MELELKSLELELELKLIVSSGIGIGIENNVIGIGIELKKWNWPQPEVLANVFQWYDWHLNKCIHLFQVGLSNKPRFTLRMKIWYSKYVLSVFNLFVH